jgi:hypothetical protein
MRCRSAFSPARRPGQLSREIMLRSTAYDLAIDASVSPAARRLMAAPSNFNSQLKLPFGGHDWVPASVCSQGSSAGLVGAWIRWVNKTVTSNGGAHMIKVFDQLGARPDADRQVQSIQAS